MKTKKPTPSDLPLATLNANSPIPLYHQIANDLRQLIENGILEPMAVLPPEKELGKRYGVGRHTMRMAMAQLVNDNLISRRAGSGTYVRELNNREKFFLDRSFTKQIRNMGQTAHSRVLRTDRGVLEDEIEPPLNVLNGANYFYLERLRFGNYDPVGLQETTILSDLCPGIEDYDFNEESLYGVLAVNYQLFINRLTHTINATVADTDQAGLLKIRRGDPLLLVKTSAYIEAEQLIEFTISYYRADKYEYSTTHYAE